MVRTPVLPERNTLLLELPKTIKLRVTQEQFEALAATNRELQLERTAEGELIVNPPTGWKTGEQNSCISGELYLWWRNAAQPGKVFDSSTGFILPNGANRAPDASWVSPERCHALTEEKKGAFARICPDFVVELRSNSDTMQSLREKMQEYMENGARLGWLINPKTKTVEVYRVGLDVEILSNPTELSGAEILSGFVLDLRRVWG
ncbi:Uma2 family endonuclease [Roseofilum casamattae]|uniref:Uma2 family endonuclease n=1 Tax=Roseofilum casamattae BLCC-M143 TaxID=3022442 RepID=A0ABT7BUX3_9CYAN|nr:Uma2 family endonuclease [Roseofilum casamattae]MDJ1182988.1 Uma2 family endonuclease [Roseofilum casamattae BLCC-M143]